MSSIRPVGDSEMAQIESVAFAFKSRSLSYLSSVFQL